METYQEARAYLNQVSKTGSILGLTSIQNLMKELGDVQEKLPIVHIAGTNGKGSTGAFIGSILQEAGYSVGRYTSPAVFSPLEVWQINGEPIGQSDYVALAQKVKTACDRMVEMGMEHPTIFEVETAMAFCYFYEKKCDYVLLEVGMGGREDATNLIQRPLCSVIASVSRDHMQFLGETLYEIARAKAGIIKKGCPVVAVRGQEEAMRAICEEAALQEAPLVIAEWEQADILSRTADAIRFSYSGIGECEIALAGSYQIKNAVLAIETAKLLLKERMSESETCDCIRSGLKKAVWQGRFERVCLEPELYLDGAHNEEAALLLRETLENCFTNRRILYIIGVLADKEHDRMLEIMLPLADRVYTISPHNPRALEAKKLAEEAAKYHGNVQACESVEEAAKCAREAWTSGDVIVAFGSLSYLGEMKSVIRQLDWK